MALATASRRPLPVATTTFLSAHRHCNGGGDAVLLLEVGFGDAQRLVLVEVLVPANTLYTSAAESSLVLVVGYLFDRIAQRLAHLRRQVKAVVLLGHEADAALAALAVDADDVRIVGAAMSCGSMGM